MVTEDKVQAAKTNLVPIHPRVGEFLRSPKRLLISGKWVDSASGKTFGTVNPATEETLARVAEADAEDVNRAVRAARAAFASGPWAKMTPAERGKLLWKLADRIEEHLEEFAQIETLDNGKPLAVARVADVPLAVDLFRYMAGWATKIEGNTIPLGMAQPESYLAYTVREPVGVVGQIIPWNFPLLMAAWKLGPALACGCTVVLKPAEQTPLSALRLGELIQEAGFPEGVVNILTGFGETAGAALAAHPDVDKVAFTGSTEVGKLIAQAATGNLKKVSLELGGKSPNIIFADANLEEAAAGAAMAIFFNHGQCCCAGSRLFVEAPVADEVAERIAKEAEKIRVGPGMALDTEMGPLVSREQYDRVQGYIRSGTEGGARARSAELTTGGRGYFVPPTLFTDVRPEMKIMREEIFGPVVCASSFRTEEEIPVAANDTIYGLAAGVWTREIGKAHKLASRLRAGTVWINCYNVFDAALPFGGYKQSGWGREMGHAVLENYTELKSVCVRL
ncbi:aldehyde dehydrogenase family protein [Verrucomicrobium sp. 3C]|uniref:aldehyde dehydrogenase family protein n=1 Tax=Verrucomicrobium sp. 3C TaxID=1134055 RepID=UPI0012DBEC22|nr:aldehyde dehydrogenase family protein [Verrucomicrobium sp. 3C]